ncbi:MAG: stage III sporulation AC/AD family protein [Oscillospiraceae bacterium]
MEFVRIAGVVLITVILVSSLPTFSKEISILLTVSCCIVVLLYTLKEAIPAMEYVKSVAELISFNGLDIVFKALGVGFITQFVSDIAVDCNNKALSNQMIFIGRVAILILAMPVFLQVFEIIERLIG